MYFLLEPCQVRVAEEREFLIAVCGWPLLSLECIDSVDSVELPCRFTVLTNVGSIFWFL